GYSRFHRIRSRNGGFIAVTCCWLTENFEFNKILLCVKKTFEDIIEALDLWKLENLKFFNGNECFYNQLKEKYQDIIYIKKVVIGMSGNDLIQTSLSRWASKHTSTQRISNIIKAVRNATNGLCGVVSILKNPKMQREMNLTINDCCSCHYHKIEFLSLLNKSFKTLLNYSNHNDGFIRNSIIRFKNDSLDNLPFSIFPELLRLFKPLEHNDVTEKNAIDLVVNAINILNEISQLTVPNELLEEYKALESFLIFLIRSYGSYFHTSVSSFLDLRSKPVNVISNWKNSKHEFPSLATLASEYLPLVSNYEMRSNNLKKCIEVYQNNDV
ncbi:10644_t:CDS:2, partial [Dentiscutata heterogama]